MEPFKKFFSLFGEISEEELGQIISLFEEVQYSKNQVILGYGEVDEYIYFLWEGIVRLANQDEKKDYSICFYYDQEIFSTFKSYAQDIPSPYQLEALTPCRIFRAHKADLENLYKKNQKFETIARRITEYLLINILEKYVDSLSLKTQERYNKLAADWGDRRIKKISIRHMASFLGIEPESLSRIRRNFKLNKKASA